VNKSQSETFQRNIFKELSGEKWIEALNRLNPKKDIPISFAGGEPSLHKDFTYIINNLKPEFKIDLVTNLWWNDNKIEEFIKNVSPEKIKRYAPYPPIRISYHPEEMGEGEKLIDNAKRLKSAGFDIGLEGVMYPSPTQLESLERMNIRCNEAKISFRVKSFIGVYNGRDYLGKPFSIVHGNYSRYPDSVFKEKTLECECKNSSLLINPEGDIYKCQRDLLLREYPEGNLLDSDLKIDGNFIKCYNYGNCHPCDVKVKTSHQQKLGTTDVEIINIKRE
jgi:MoaA/NifB/PqqE/SkfB family radical SAM enzyme